MSKLKTLLLFSLIHFFIPNSGMAMTFDREYLYNFIKNEVGKQIVTPAQGKIQIEVSKIDPRIQLQPCHTPLQANIPEKHNGRNVNVKIVCHDENRWHIFVPVKIQTIIPILVANSRLTRGTVLDESNIQTVLKDSSLIRGTVLTSAKKVIGARLKRSLSKGAPVTTRNVCFVCKGELVTITAKSANFMIKSSGVALKDGSLGEQVTIKNEKSGRIVRAQVIAINQVVINL